MRTLVCVMIGMLVGAVAVMTVTSALQRHNVWPRAVMNVMQHELGEARTITRGAPCTGASTQSAKEHLQLLAADLERAMLPPATHDRIFTQYANDLRTALMQWQPAADCAQQTAALTTITNTCDACHRDFQ